MTDGSAVSPDETAVAAANLGFYRSLEARSLSGMDVVWSHSDRTGCVHPGWHRLDGWDEIRRSFANIFASSRPWTVSCEDVRVVALGDAAWVSCVEVIRPFGADRSGAVARMQSTNIFIRESGEWKLLHHHASASPDDTEAEEDVTVN